MTTKELASIFKTATERELQFKEENVAIGTDIKADGKIANMVFAFEVEGQTRLIEVLVKDFGLRTALKIVD